MAQKKGQQIPGKLSVDTIVAVASLKDVDCVVGVGGSRRCVFQSTDVGILPCFLCAESGQCW